MNHAAVLVLVVVVIIAVIAVAAYFYSRERRSKLLKEHFGPEYDRVVEKEKDVRRAEATLAMRTRARKAFQIRPLAPSDKTNFANHWNLVQSRFVDDPSGAVVEADRLVDEVMEARGYPVQTFEQQAEIVSVDHPVVVQNYRAAHDIALRQNQGNATTEDLRKAVVYYRSLFDELLNNTSQLERKEVHR